LLTVNEETTGMEEAQVSTTSALRDKICVVKCFYLVITLQSGS